MSYENLKEAVLAVEENNRINDASWSGWGDVSDIVSVYSIGALTIHEIDILNRAIETNGATIEADMNEAHDAECGVKFNTWRK